MSENSGVTATATHTRRGRFRGNNSATVYNHLPNKLSFSLALSHLFKSLFLLKPTVSYVGGVMLSGLTDFHAPSSFVFPSDELLALPLDEALNVI